MGTVLPCLMPTSTAAAMTCLEVPLCGITWVVRVRVRVRVWGQGQGQGQGQGVRVSLEVR